MLVFIVPVLLSLAATARAYHREYPHSAASDAQIRFAIENKYDDTGPGAKEPQYAFHTYKNLDEALVAYLDDPDTKLPEQERNRAIEKLQSTYNNNYGQEIQRYYPKTVEEYTGYNKQQQQQQQQQQKPKIVLTKLIKNPFGFIGAGDRKAEPYRLQRLQSVRGNPLSVAHYSREPPQGQFNPYPKYTFSYGVNGPDTGDHKSAQETREGGNVKGYYSFLDADGTLRTVHYTANDQVGFQASVEKTNPYQEQNNRK